MKSAIEIQNILNEVCFGSAHEVRSAVEKYFSPGYRQFTDGQGSDREVFIQHLLALRNHLAGGEIRVDAFLCSGNSFADRHHVHATKVDGSQVELEVYMFGEIDAHGKILVAHEMTRVISGGGRDSELGRVDR